MKNIRILTLSGSLRSTSRNTALLRAAAQLAPAHIQMEFFDQLGLIPPFNPELNGADFASVSHLKELIMRADGVLIASPEYAHGVSGVMKNALDWMVGTEAFVDKPVAMFNAAPRAHHAYDSLKETLKLMSSYWIETASITIPVVAPIETSEHILGDAGLSQAILHALMRFHTGIIEREQLQIST